MCGIAGLFDLRGKREPDRDALARMLDALRYRGPDGEGTFVRPGLALGHRRLAIIDVEGGDQPMVTPAGDAAVVFNGMIYNYRELTWDLEAAQHRFTTRCDTETVLHGSVEWDDGVTDRLDGFFAFAAWREADGSLLLARDRVGKKPLYYTLTPDGWLFFASEMTALIRGLGRTPPLRADAVADYFAFGYVPDPKSIFDGVFKLPPAHRLRLRPGAGDTLAAPERYWSVRFEPDTALADDMATIAALDSHLNRAVRDRMVADVPLGAFLSGGVDSSGIVAVMAAASARPVETCTMGFDDPAFDESRYAGLVAERYGTNHHCEVVAAQADDLIDRLALAYGEPFADGSALPTFLVSRLARQHVTVALSGDGGDELFAGYRRYPFHVREESVKARMPAAFRRTVFGPLARAYPEAAWAPRPLRAKATFEALASDTVAGYFRALTLTPDPVRRRLLSGPFQEALDGYHPAAVLRDHAARAGTDDPLARAQYIDFHTWLPGQMLVKVDRASMANGLEVRNPLLDTQLIEWASKLPTAMKLDGFAGKRILKKALEPKLPREVLYRPKQGFAAPFHAWLKGGLDARLRDVAASRMLRESGVIETGAVDRLIAEHRSGRRDRTRTLWSVIMFDAFLRQL